MTTFPLITDVSWDLNQIKDGTKLAENTVNISFGAIDVFVDIMIYCI